MPWLQRTRVRRPSRNRGLFVSSDSGKTWREISVVMSKTRQSYASGSMPIATCSAGRVWSRTNIVA